MTSTVFIAHPTIFTPWGKRTILPKEEAKIKVADLLREQGYRVNLGRQGQNCLWITNCNRQNIYAFTVRLIIGDGD